MNYDETIQKAEEIVKELEQADALSMETYNKKSAAVRQLLDTCERQLKDLEQLLV